MKVAQGREPHRIVAQTPQPRATACQREHAIDRHAAGLRRDELSGKRRTGFGGVQVNPIYGAGGGHGVIRRNEGASLGHEA